MPLHVIRGLDAVDPPELLRSKTPAGIYLAVSSERGPSNHWPTVDIVSTLGRDQLLEFVKDNWGPEDEELWASMIQEKNVS